MERFRPPRPKTAGNAPAIAESVKTAGPKETVIFSGSKLSKVKRYRFFSQTRSGNALDKKIKAMTRARNGAAIRIPGKAKRWSMYLVWPKRKGRTGRPVAVNRTEAWWAGPKPAIRGRTAAVYGRNLSKRNGTKRAWVYMTRKNSKKGNGRWLRVVDVNLYRVTFRVPRKTKPGAYQIWAHNGHGGHFGWSDPVTLRIGRSPWRGQSKPVFNVRDYNAKGDGSTDDEQAIQRALDAAARAAPSTVYFPPGTYMVSRGFQPPGKVRWLGAGQSKTIIRARSDFRNDANDPRTFAMLFAENYGRSNSNVEFKNLTLDQNGNEGRLDHPIWMRRVKNIRFTNVTVKSRPGFYFNFEFSDQIHLKGSTFIGNGGYLGDANQVFIDDSTFRLSHNANSALATQGGGGEVSITDTVIRDYDSSTPEGTGAGRFFVSQGQKGSTEHYFFSGNKTVNLAPPNQNWSQFDPNAGEQILFEQCCSGAIHTIASASRRTFRLDGSAGGLDPDVPRDIMVNSGPGVGQTRRLVSYDPSSGRYKVDRPWQVVPPKGSKVTLASTASKIAIYKNRFDGKSAYASKDTASSAVQLYSNSVDIVIDGNTITNMRGGVEMWSMGNDSDTELNAVYFNLAANNRILDSYDAIADYTMYFYRDVPDGVGHLGNVYRRNTGKRLSNAGISIRLWPDYEAGAFRLNAFDHNVFRNTPGGIIAGNLHIDDQTPLLKTILNKNRFIRGTAPYSDSKALLAPDEATWVNRGSKWKGFQSYNDLP